jgi:hypothetical protein
LALSNGAPGNWGLIAGQTQIDHGLETVLAAGRKTKHRR